MSKKPQTWRNMSSTDRFFYFGSRATHKQVYIGEETNMGLYIGFHNCETDCSNDHWLIRFAGKTHKVTKYGESYQEEEVKELALKLVKLELKLALEAQEKIRKLLE